MAEATKIEHASVLNDKEVAIEFSDGSTVVINAEQLLSLRSQTFQEKELRSEHSIVGAQVQNESPGD